MSKLQFKTQEINGQNSLILTGQIDETFPAELIGFSGGEQIIINLENIKLINSLGIREWIKFVNSIAAQKIIFTNCPKVFIDQVNMVQGFLPANCHIESFYVPYFNEDTNLEKNILYKFGEDFGENFVNVKGSMQLPDGSELELDVVEQKYFKFLKK